MFLRETEKDLESLKERRKRDEQRSSEPCRLSVSPHHCSPSRQPSRSAAAELNQSPNCPSLLRSNEQKRNRVDHEEGWDFKFEIGINLLNRA